MGIENFFGAISFEEAKSVSSEIYRAIYSISIHYNDSDYAYDENWPDKNVIRVETIVPNLVGQATEANTGLSYDRSNNELIVVSGVSNEFRINRKFETVATLGDLTSQGLAYDSINGKYYVLLSTGIKEVDSQGNTIIQMNFPEAEPSPGMLFYHEFEDLFYTTYDVAEVIKIWKPDRQSGILNLHQTINFDAEEGCAVDYANNNIWVNVTSAKQKINHSGDILFNFPFTGSTGLVNEGLVVDPTDGTLWFNSDEFYHGSIDGGNRLWHIDPEKKYNKNAVFPKMIPWDAGALQGLTIEGSFNRSVLKLSSSVGEWVSPIMDYQSYILQQNEENIIINKSGNAVIEFRGSDTAPDTLETDIFPIHFYDANQLNEGWGTTVPGAWQSTPVTNQYMQIRITL